MFYLSEIEHTLRLPPHLLNLPLDEAIKGELEGLFLDKVISNLGLCISIYDIQSIDGGFIFPGDGASTYTVKFRMIMFRPFLGEVIGAKLKASSANGLHLSLGFFDDIYVPVHLMPNPSHSEPDPENKNQVRWIWEFNGDNYPIDGIDEIRFRVHSVSYPSIPVEQEKEKESTKEKESKQEKEKESKQEKESKHEKEKESKHEKGKESKQQKELKPFAPMVVTGSLDADGLGPISWWV